MTDDLQTQRTPIDNPEVAAVFQAYPEEARERLLALRELILETASITEGVGELEETLKWGEPSYLTTQSKSGSTIRIAWKASAPQQYGMYVNCQTSLIASFKQTYPNTFTYGGKRSILFHQDDELPLDALSHCIAIALTYHRDK